MLKKIAKTFFVFVYRKTAFKRMIISESFKDDLKQLFFLLKKGGSVMNLLHFSLGKVNMHIMVMNQLKIFSFFFFKDIFPSNFII